MAKEIKWERLTPTEAETLSALVKSGKTVYAAPIEIEKNKEDRQRQFEALNITQDDCKTWRIGSEKVIVHLTPADEATYKFLFDETLVKRLITKITVFENHFTIDFKSGVTIDIEA